MNPLITSVFCLESTFQIKVQEGRSQAEYSAVEAEIITEGSRKFAEQIFREEGTMQ